MLGVPQYDSPMQHLQAVSAALVRHCRRAVQGPLLAEAPYQGELDRQAWLRKRNSRRLLGMLSRASVSP